MKKIYFLKVIISVFISFTVSCSDDDGPDRNDSSIVPEIFLNRPVVVQDEISIENREITISVWDGGNSIDGDIISVYVNGEEIIAERVLDGPSNKFSVVTTLEFEGFNYLLLFAHNEGIVPPNTASISINDGNNESLFILDAGLSTNGAIDIIVN